MAVIMFFHSNDTVVNDIYRAIPAFAWHRQNWNILHPFVELDNSEIEQLKGSNHYVAGFTDATIEGR